MEYLENAKTIRLKTHNGKYLTASNDEKSIRQKRDGSTVNALWAVEFLDDQQYLRLKSCHGKYLTASNVPLLPKVISQSSFSSHFFKLGVGEVQCGESRVQIVNQLSYEDSPVTASRKVMQTLPKKLCSATEWEAEQDGSLYQIRLKTRYGHFLRPFGGIPPWRNIVTHDVPHRKKATLWEIEIMETHKKALPAPTNFAHITKAFSCNFTEPI
ncbi:hypothetical protein H5410_006873 [Solanum commersonii]|uniref:DUF569 domain-containing protein n=1 Tax=Solanum commersonii TaxID=4109 RepID=A0A9J6ACJ7_SOLCO|nr:hypothetical protein H5410_006873 [Solanum commersonii]